MVHVDKIFLYMDHLGIGILDFGYHHQPFLKWRYCFWYNKNPKANHLLDISPTPNPLPKYQWDFHDRSLPTTPDARSLTVKDRHLPRRGDVTGGWVGGG